MARHGDLMAAKIGIVETAGADLLIGRRLLAEPVRIE